MSTATASAETTTGHQPVEAVTEGGAPIMSHREILLVLYGLMAAMFLSSLGQTVFGTAIRTIGDDLKGLDQQAWVTTAFLITSTISVPIYGKLSDIFGRRPLFIFGIVIFLLGSLASAFSTSMLMLAGFRAFQGIGAGALMSLPLAIMGDILAPRQRAKYQGYFFAVFGISTVIGPLIGGLFAGADQILWIDGWRWVLLINIPIGLIALGMVIAFLHLPKFSRHSSRIDWWGAALVVATLVPLLLIAEQGREWGWASPGAIACYVIGGLSLVGFVIVERAMKDDAIIPLKLFRSHTFAMATVLSVLVGFGMFGAMLTLPLYLQIVVGLNPTQSGLALIPLVVGLMIASITAGQITARTGQYRIFPIIGTAVTAVGFLLLTFERYDTPLWTTLIGMFVVGLGIGQLMQTLTLAAQNSVQPHEIGVATSGATFFRQIGGTLGVAIMLSVLFSALPGNIVSATANRATLAPALSAALDPEVAQKPENTGIMRQIWTPIVTPIQADIQKQLDAGVAMATAAADAAVTDRVTSAVEAQVAAGRVPASAASSVIAQQVAAATPRAEQSALAAVADKAHASVSGDSVAVDWSNGDQRAYWVDQLAPKISSAITKKGSAASSSSSGSISDTSFLTGADPRLSKPFLVGFTSSTVMIFWIGFAVILLAFVLSLFFRVPPLRSVSALQARADSDGVTATGTIGIQPPAAAS